MAVALTYLDTQVDTGNRSSYSIAMSFGAASAGREILVVVSLNETTIASVSLDSVGDDASPVEIVKFNHSAATLIVGRASPTGTSGNVVVTSNGSFGVGIVTYSVYGADAITVTDTHTGANPSLSVATDDSGAVLGALASINTSSPTGLWDALTEDEALDYESNDYISTASLEYVTGTTESVTMTLAAGGGLAAALLAIPPLPVLTAEHGTYTLTGQDVSLEVGHRLAVGHGSYTLTGQDVSLERGLNLAVETGSYSLTGQDVTLTYTPADNPTLAAEHGTYALTGQAVSLEVGRNLAAEHGSYTLTGQAVSFLRDLVLAAESGTYTLSGQDAALLIGHLLTAEHGTYTLSGQDVTLAKGRTLAAEFGSYALTGQAVGLFRGYPLAAEFGSYVLSGQDVDLSRTFSGLTAEYGSYVLTGQPVNLEHGRALAAEYGVYTLTGQDIAFLRGLGLSAEYGSFILSGQSVILGNIFKLGVGCGTFALTGQDVSLIYLPNTIGTVTDRDEITISPTALTNITTTRSIGNSITSSPDFRVIN